MTTTKNPPRSQQGGLYLPIGIGPDILFQAWSRQRREALIEVLIDSLDAADGDTDMEPCADLEDGQDLEQCDWRAA
jgi:hypothetical protein